MLIPGTPSESPLVIAVSLLDQNGVEVAEDAVIINLDRTSPLIPYYEGTDMLVRGSHDLLPVPGDTIFFDPIFILPDGWEILHVQVTPSSFIMPNEEEVEIPIQVLLDGLDINGEPFVISIQDKLRALQDEISQLIIDGTINLLSIWALLFKIKDGAIDDGKKTLLPGGAWPV